jgi:chromosome segregation ATPase
LRKRSYLPFSPFHSCLCPNPSSCPLLQLAPPSSPQDVSTSASGSGSADLQDQNNRLKEALRRLQSLHLSNEKNLQTVIAKYEEDLRLLREDKEALEGSHERAEELQLQLELTQEEIKELAQQIDDSSGYADMVESLSTKNSELSMLVQKFQETIEDLEATQEVQEELDQSQRQEIESLRKGNDQLLVGIQTIEMEKGELYRKISDWKLKNERLAK